MSALRLPRGLRGLTRSPGAGDEKGAVVMTAMHIFVGGLTIGLAVMRGTESRLAFQTETTLGHANYGATKLGTDHARAANSIATNNTISGAVMGPRLAVESANIVMDGTGQIACAACSPSDSYMCRICQQYNQNKPRGTAKQVWARAKQAMIWSSLSSLSGQMDKMASAKAAETIASKVAAVDDKVTMTTEDPSLQADIWAGDSSQKACDLAAKDAEKSPMQESPFPLLMINLLPGLPTALIATLGSRICGAGSDASKTGSGSAPNLGMIPSVSKASHATCDGLEASLNSRSYVLNGILTGRGGPSATSALSSAQSKYLTCSGSSAAPAASSSTTFVRQHGKNCAFDMNKCLSDQTTINSNAFLETLGLPSSVGSGLGGMTTMLGKGQSTRAPADDGWNVSPSFQACSHAAKPVDESIISLTRAVKTVGSFFTAKESNVLTQKYDYASCAKWYFPDGPSSSFASVAHDEQPFTAAWTSGPTWQGKKMKTFRRRRSDRRTKRGISTISLTLETTAVLGWFVVMILGEKVVGDATSARRSAETAAQQTARVNGASYCQGTSIPSTSGGAPVPANLATGATGSPSAGNLLSLVESLGFGSQATLKLYTQPFTSTQATAQVDNVKAAQLLGGDKYTFSAQSQSACREKPLDKPGTSITEYRNSVFLTNISGWAL